MIIVGGSSGYGGGGMRSPCSGGGRSAIQYEDDDLVTAGGGGGGSYGGACGESASSFALGVIQNISYQEAVAVGGITTSCPSSPSSICNALYSGGGGGGGSISSVGDGCNEDTGLVCGSGTKYQGGNGLSKCYPQYGAGGGGGGYYGGGGGVAYCDTGSGGGGSSYLRNLQ